MRVPAVSTVNGAVTTVPWVTPSKRGVWHNGRLFVEDDVADATLIPSDLQVIRGRVPSYAQGFAPGWDTGLSYDFGQANASVVDAPGTTYGKALRATYPAGSRDPASPIVGGCGWRTGSVNADVACLRYKVRFSAGFDFNLGGKLPGLYGGAGNTGGNIPNGVDGWSTRFMFQPTGRLIVYAYLPTSVTWGTAFPVSGATMVPGQWHAIEQATRLNTPGVADGEIVVRFDGVHMLHVSGLRFRDIDALMVDGVLFSTFFGGDTAEWNSPQDQYAEFADFEIF